MMKYSPSTRGFYDEAMVAPDDAVNVPDDEYRALFAAQRTGKSIEPNDVGYPVAVDPPPATLTPEMLMAVATQQMDDAARASGYSSLADVISYADDANPIYAADAQRFRAWRSEVRAFALAAKPNAHASPAAFAAALPALGA